MSQRRCRALTDVTIPTRADVIEQQCVASSPADDFATSSFLLSCSTFVYLSALALGLSAAALHSPANQEFQTESPSEAKKTRQENRSE